MKKSVLLVLLSGVFLLAFCAFYLPFSPAETGQPPSEVNHRQAERDRMVEQQITSREVASPSVLEAMRTVARHLFVPEDQRRYAYFDCPLPIGHGQTISQPFIVAYMTEALDLKPGDRVLEIGTGSGYQAAVLARMKAKVYTVEIIQALGEPARERLRELGFDDVNIRIGDGYYGWEEFAPFDAIIVTAAAGHVPPPLLKQLRPGGTMVIPVGSPYQIQTLMKVMKSESGELSTRSLIPVSFVPMTGQALEK
ncbi:MAG: protein-L-isoaspartate(D-aspartate) O-methyltransferase [Proteobacteria bacterium]|nr:protein-L-isoaspartate(D-aspartate) O-methyltransferase [Pseudomonadota bacterium]